MLSNSLRAGSIVLALSGAGITAAQLDFSGTFTSSIDLKRVYVLASYADQPFGKWSVIGSTGSVAKGVPTTLTAQTATGKQADGRFALLASYFYITTTQNPNGTSTAEEHHGVAVGLSATVASFALENGGRGFPEVFSRVGESLVEEYVNGNAVFKPGQQLPYVLNSYEPSMGFGGPNPHAFGQGDLSFVAFSQATLIGPLKVTVTPVPEPSFALVGLGALALCRRRRTVRRQATNG